jgi:hypothetical protein
MTKKEIQVGNVYIAKVSGALCRVRVTGIREIEATNTKKLTRYEAVNLETGRSITVRSAARFRRESM